MTGNVRQVKGYPALVDPKVVDEITRQVQRRDDLVSELELVDGPWADRQHVHLYLATGVLVLLEQVQAGSELAVGLLQLLAVALVLQQQARTIQGPAHRVLEHGQIFERLDQVVRCAQAQGFDRVVHHARTRHHDHRCLRRQLGDLADELESAHLRHAQIADDQIGLVLLEYLKTLLTIAGLQDAETTVFQIGGEARAHYFVIIDYQQRGTGFWHVGKRRQN